MTITYTLDNTAGSGSLDIGDVQKEEINVVSIILNFEGIIDDFTSGAKTSSSDTTATFLTKVFKPQSRITVSGIKKCADATALRSFSDSLLAFSGIANNNSTFRYSGLLDTTYDGLIEDMRVSASVGNLFIVEYSFTMLAGTVT